MKPEQFKNKKRVFLRRIHTERTMKKSIMSEKIGDNQLSATAFIGVLLEVRENALASIRTSDKSLDELRITLLGRNSELAKHAKQIRRIPQEDRQRVGTVLNSVKQEIIQALGQRKAESSATGLTEFFDVTAPGEPPPEGHLHIVTQAINEITRIFERIGYTRVRHPEVDWDWYAFESLNMPAGHAARDEWETFFINNPIIQSRNNPISSKGNRYSKIVLTPHTSNGQVREMEKGVLPIRMINIAKCYRRQIDVSHTPMFHQFEGLYIDKGVSIGHLKGVLDFFVKQFFGHARKTRIRPFHFQFTEPSFEVDITCGICGGRGQGCRLCKEGWLELGGAGMVHPEVLKNGHIDPGIYNGFAFGWGIERTYMMKAGTKIDDIRLLYGNDIRFLEQF